MRWLGLVVLVTLGACADGRVGTLFVIDGAAAGIEFSRVDVYFGIDRGDDIPVSKPRPVNDPTAAAEQGAAMKIALHDELALSGELTELKYLVEPEAVANQRIGDYVLVIAYDQDGTRVGIAEELADELAGEVSSDALVIWPIELEAYGRHVQEVEDWGRPEIDCLKWTRARGGGAEPTTIALVRGADLDCDAFRDDEDCAPMVFCDPSSGNDCAGSVPCLIDGPPCQLGRCQNRDGATAVACEPTACLVNAACTECEPDLSIEDRLVCAMHSNSTHRDHTIPLDAGALCLPSYTFRIQIPNHPCTNPEIEVVVGSTTNVLTRSPFTFEVEEDGGVCAITITEPAPDEPFVDIPHVLISFGDPVQGGRRSSIDLGISGSVGACGEVTLVLESPIGACDGP